MKDQKKGGILLSYCNIALSMCINIVLTPMMITALSDETYSIYKIMQSLSGPLIIFNLGLATVTARYVAKYRVVGDEFKKEKENALAMALIVAVVMAVLVLLVSILLIQLIPYLYGSNYDDQQIMLAKQLFFLFAVSAGLTIISDVYKGCVSGCERFVFANGLRTMQLLIKLALTVVFLKLGMGALAVAAIELINTVLGLVSLIGYSKWGLREQIKLHSWDKVEFCNMLTFSVAILLQAIINQVNNNMDVMILGAMLDQKYVITMYSSALSIYTIYNSMISTFSSVFYPSAVRLVECRESGIKLTDFVIRLGRVQAMIAVATLGAFALFGANFIRIWIGQIYENAYHVALIIMIPVTIPLVQNGCLAILDAKMKRMFRSVVLFLMAGINVVISIILIRHIGFWGAAVGTAISLIVGHGIIMNIYYKRVIGLEVVRMFREIFQGILPCGILSMLLCLPLVWLIKDNFSGFIFKCIAFSAVYLAILWKIGMNSSERQVVNKLFKGFLNKK